MGRKISGKGLIVNELFLEVFDCEIISIIGDSSDEIMDLLEDKWGYIDTQTDIQGYTDFLMAIDHTVSIFTAFVREYMTPGLIAHESYHAITRMTAYLGIRDEETQALALDWLVDQQHRLYKDELLNWYKK